MSTNTKFRTAVGLLGMAMLSAASSACIYEVGIPADGNKPAAELNPMRGMAEQAKFRDQEAQPIFRVDQPKGMRYPPAQTLPVDARSYLHINDKDISRELVNPVAITEESLNYGRYAYKTACAVCHGAEGDGKGYIVPKYPQPPSLLSDRVRNMADGEIFHVITHGQGTMWAYKNQLDPMERWAAVNYIRALQRADFPEPADFERTTP